MNPDRFQPWASAAMTAASTVLAVGSAYSAVALASTAPTRAAYAGAVVGFGAHAVVAAHRTRAHVTERRDATGSAVGATDISWFCFYGALVLTTVPNFEPDWRPLFLVVAAFAVLLGLGGLVAGNRRVRERLGWEVPET